MDSPKTASKGKPWRLVPLVPELLAMLERAFHEAPEGAEFMLPALRLHSNPGMPLLRAVRLAGLEPWPRTFHALRASCETDWAARHPIADVAAWMGHSRVVAAAHYLRATEGSFAAVTCRDGGDTGGDSRARSVVTPVVMQSAAQSSTEQHDTPNTPSTHDESAPPRNSAPLGAESCDSASHAASGPYWT